MTESRRERADRLFDQALDLSPPERAELLAAECGDDHELRALVERLLSAADEETWEAVGEGGALQGEVAEDLARALESQEGSGLVGRKLGNFRVVRELGRGGMAIVYLAQREGGDFEQRVAIKLIRGEIESPLAIRRFNQERQILARSSHPNIARLLDGGLTEDHRPYLVMEEVAGEPIDRYCDGHRLTVRQRLELFLEAARAVGHAHRSLIVHRDIKPSNILVTGDGHVKLLDFGIAKLLDAEAEATRTRTELRAMTPLFASPEQVQGEPITTATDIYQLGLLLYVLLTGCWPYTVEPKADAALYAAIAGQDPTRPSAVITTGRIRDPGSSAAARDTDALASDRRTTPERMRRLLSGDLDTIVLKCLRKEPERRYGTVAQLIEDLEKHLEGRPIAARPDTFAYRATKFFGRHRVASVIGGVAVAIVISLVAWDNARLARERDRARFEAEKATEVSRFLRGLFEVAAPTRSLGEAITARELLDRGAARVRSELESQPELQAEMMQLIGSVYGELAFFEEGEALLEEAVAIRRRMPGEESRDLASALLALGELHNRNRSLSEAEAELEEARALEVSALGPAHPEVARIEVLLGAVLTSDSQLKEAREVLERAVATLEDAAPESADYGRALTWLAVVTRDERDYEASIPLFREATGVLEASLGPDHPDTILPLFNLAYSLRYTGDPEGAEAVYQESIDRYLRLYGSDHPRLGMAYNNYSLLLRQMERWDDAVEMQTRALENWKKSLGPEHFQVTWAYNNLGLIAEHRGDLEEARELYRQTLELTEKIVEPGHGELAVPLQNLGKMLTATGQAAEAIPYLERALEIRERIYGADHSFVGATQKHLGLALFESGDLDAAEARARRAIEIGLAQGEDWGHRITDPRILLARILVRRGRSDEARALLEEEWELTNEEGREEMAAAWPSLFGEARAPAA